MPWVICLRPSRPSIRSRPRPRKFASYPLSLAMLTCPEGRCFGLRTAECIAQCLNLEHEIHHTASKLCILGFEPLK
jgi:hypothetical protein